MVKTGRPVNQDVYTAFTKFKDSNYKEARARCHYCLSVRAWQTTDLSRHLDKCVAYKSTLDASMKAAREQKQWSIVVPSIGPQRAGAITRKFALGTYMANLPFNIWSNKFLRAAILDIHNKIKLPDEKQLSGTLLDTVYGDTAAKVIPLVQNSRHINLVMDESSNIKRQRVMNLCASVPSHGSFYVLSHVLGSHSLSADWTARWFVEQSMKLVKGEPWRINALITDTCPTQRSAWHLIEQDERFKHVFFVPCESHSLQLFIGDILQTPWFADLFQKAHLIINIFLNSPLQLSRLREIMEDVLGRQYAFVLSVLTRWGTQLAMVRSLIKIMPALTKYFTKYASFEDQSEEKKTFMRLAGELVWSKDFNQDLELMNEILSPIHEAIKMSESDSCVLRHVISHWINILTAIQEHNNNQDSADIALMEERCFKPRYSLQVAPIHVIAWLLDPTNAGSSDNRGVPAVPYIFESQWREMLHNEFTRQGIHHVAAMQQFNEYWRQEGRFTTTSPVWQYRTDTEQFWLFMQSQCPELAPLALRLARTPANSVPSERSFSILNIIHTKGRNKLQPDHVDKLQFVYINERVLARITRRNTSPADLEELEDQLIRCGIGEEGNPGLFQDPRMSLKALLS